MGRCDVDSAILRGEGAGSFDVRPSLEKRLCLDRDQFCIYCPCVFSEKLSRTFASEFPNF